MSANNSTLGSKNKFSALLMAIVLIFGASTVVFADEVASESPVSSSENWKGRSSPAEMNLSLLNGLGIFQQNVGYYLIGAVAKKIVNRGFVPDVNNQVFVEIEVGPLFSSLGTTVHYGAHLRWDFEYDHCWTFYALGGVAGEFRGRAFNPRFGLGAFYWLNDFIRLRTELTHDLIGVGVSVNF